VADPAGPTGARLSRRLTRLSRHWHRLGDTDPLWAVYVAPDTKNEQWDLPAFLRTGRDEVDRVLAGLPRQPAGHRLALDFGCGVGRLSQALAEHFDQVIGVDVSAPMLRRAAELAADSPVRDRLEFRLNDRPDLALLADASVDLVYSSLVLQHLPRSLAAGYLGEFVRVLRPGGLVVVQVASAPTRSVKGWAFRLLPAPVLGVLQRLLLRYPAPMRMQAMPDRWFAAVVSAAGGRVIDSAEDASYGGHWVYTRYLVEHRLATDPDQPAGDR
jgi:ubiquinone/menaquinone biosynthesis C-methylase UbiE